MVPFGWENMAAVDEEVKGRRLAAKVAPILPLGLLESVRAHDRPEEVFEDEDLPTSLPRRFGLTDVVESQIRRYEQAQRRGTAVPADEVMDLLRLILRRPDAQAILSDAGRSITADFFGPASRPSKLALRVLPQRALAGTVRRATKRLLRRLVGPGKLVVSGRPPTVRIIGSATAELDAGGTACVLYGSALEELVFRYTRDRRVIEHTQCAARGAEACVWPLLP